MFKPNFKIGSFAPPQPVTTAAVPNSSDISASTSVASGSSDTPSSSLLALPNKQPAAAAQVPFSANDDDDIAEEVEYDEVMRLISMIVR